MSEVAYNPYVVLNSIDSEHWLLVAFVFGFAEIGMQLALMVTHPFRPIGDEIEYIERGRSGRPFNPIPFFRVPLLPSVAWLGGQIGHTSAFLRLVSVVMSATAMAATAGAAARLGGAGIATVLCLGLFLIPERMILGSRIWPDVYLAAATSVIILVMSLTPSIIDLDRSAALVGILVANATLIRLDALVLVPSVAATWALVTSSFSLAQAGCLIGLPLVVFAMWWLLAVLFLNQRWPDNTWSFNLGITVQAALVQREGGSFTIDDLVERHQAEIRKNQEGDPTRGRDSGRPVPWRGFVSSAASSFRAILGPDTFVRGKLLADAERSNELSTRPIVFVLLRVSVPWLVAATVGLFALRPTAAGWLAAPALALLVPAVLFHARTRYRLPLLYGLLPVLAGSIGWMLTRPPVAWSPAVISIVVLTPILGLLLGRETRRLERL